MLRRTSHCVCQPNSSLKENPLKSDQIFQINSTSDDTLMHSPPLPPRTLKNNILSTTKKYPINKNSFSEWNEKADCYNKKNQCNCSRPHSCPAEESTFILTPPIPPKTCQIVKSKNQKQLTDEQVKSKTEQIQIETRNSNRHRRSEKSSSRKKSRSNSRSIAREEKSQIDKLPSVLHENMDIRVNKYFMKNHDSLVDKNCHKNYHKTNELCKICENNEHTLKFQSRPPFPDIGPVQSELQQPDLISDQSNALINSQSQNKSCSNKLRNKWKAKISQFWTKSKKSSAEIPSPINRDVVITPENTGHMSKYTEEAPRPRRSKSLHLIPDTSLSPKSSMQTKPSGQQLSDAGITKNTGIFAVISPSTARWKRNLFCISPKTGSSSTRSKKSDYNISVGSTSASNNVCQQRNPPSLISTGRISPVHLIAKSSNHNNLSDSVRREKDPLVGSSAHNSAKQNRQEVIIDTNLFALKYKSM